jgi:hypothetical protein
MKSQKRFFLITALTALLFAAIAVGPTYKRSNPPVHAATSTHATVILLCATVEPSNSEFLPAPVVVAPVDDSDTNDVFSPAITTGEDCAMAINSIFADGFSRLDSQANGSAFVTSPLTSPPSASAGGVWEWTFVR